MNVLSNGLKKKETLSLWNILSSSPRKKAGNQRGLKWCFWKKGSESVSFIRKLGRRWSMISMNFLILPHSSSFSRGMTRCPQSRGSGILRPKSMLWRKPTWILVPWLWSKSPPFSAEIKGKWKRERGVREPPRKTLRPKGNPSSSLTLERSPFWTDRKARSVEPTSLGLTGPSRGKPRVLVLHRVPHGTRIFRNPPTALFWTFLSNFLRILSAGSKRPLNWRVRLFQCPHLRSRRQFYQ